MDEFEWRLVDLKSGRVYELTVTACGDGDVYGDSSPSDIETFKTLRDGNSKLHKLADTFISGFLTLEPVKVGYLR